MSVTPRSLLVAFTLVMPAIVIGEVDESTGLETNRSEKTNQKELTPAHVFQRVSLLKAEINLIRLEMGKPEVTPPPIRVEKAAPREVYFQALTLFRKSDRLAFEHTLERKEEPPTPGGEIRPADVLVMVEAALERIARVKEALAISESLEAPALEADIEPSDVFNTIVAANREINRLLDRQFAPDDVYQQVTVAIAFLARLLDSPGEVSAPPDPPPFERRKRPSDVYGKLVGCFGKIREIGDRSGIAMLDIEVDDSQVDQTEPSDVYDIASLLVSELAYLHGQRPGALPPRKVYPPGRKLPSHVYQRIGILCGQIETLVEKVEENPNFLTD